jgi:acyl-CoA synthetase (AMP-forming)/AMP-acid ligase II
VQLNIIRQVRNIFDQQANRVFLFDGLAGRQFTYGDFYRMAGNAAKLLRSQGIERHGRVALVLNNSAEFAALYFACLFLGAVAVPVNPALHPREVAFILAHSGTNLVIVSPTTQKALSALAAHNSPPRVCLVPKHEREHELCAFERTIIELDAAPVAPDWQPMREVAEHDLFSITFTSGTTRMPKGVAHRIGTLLENATAFNVRMGFNHEHRFLHVMPMAYMAGFLNMLLCPFMAGASVVLERAFDAKTAMSFWQPVMEFRADTFWLAPTMLVSLLRLDRNPAGLEYARRNIKAICVGTAPLPPRTRKDFEAKYGVRLLESYGLSELLLVAINTTNGTAVDNSVGPPLPGIGLRVLGETGQDVRPGGEGEIWIRTPYMMAGYLNYQTLEPEPIKPTDWFPTGDLGRLDEDGQIFITGRQKDLIIRGGLNISPRAVEEILEEHEAVDQVAVIGLPNDFYGEEVAAVVKLKPGYTLEAVRQALCELCRENLSAVAVPTQFLALEAFPVSSTGKVQKAKLREMYSANSST